MANELIIDVNDSGYDTNYGYNRGTCAIGNNLFGFGSGPSDGALRFTNVVTTGTVDFAVISFKYGSASDQSSGNWKHILYGMDDDNTSDFGGSPFGNSRTSASVTTDDGGGGPQTNGSKEFNVTSIFNEIVSRGGWSSGNAMGFFWFDNGSSDQIWAYANLAQTHLVYRQSALPNFKPTPISVTASAFPAPTDYGISIAGPGKSVITASDEELYFTTRKKQLKIFMEGEVSGSQILTVTHNLGYHPIVVAYYQFPGSDWQKFYLFGNFDIANYYEINDNNVVFTLDNSSTKVYYYIFLDQLAT